MKKGKYAKGGVGAKALILVLTVALLVGVSVGGTLAWLTDTSDKVVNTFTDSDIEITLEETKKDFKMIPGWTIDKDPYITVEANSEDCYLFVQVTKSTNLDNYIAYRVNQSTVVTTAEKELPEEGTITLTHGGWSVGTGTGEGKNGVPTNVYFRKVAANTADQYFAVLGKGEYTDTNGTTETTDDVKYTWADDQVLVLPSVTKSDMEDIDGTPATEKQPTLTFKAYAVQLWKNNTTEFTPEEAWANAQNVENQQTGNTSGT